MSKARGNSNTRLLLFVTMYEVFLIRKSYIIGLESHGAGTAEGRLQKSKVQRASSVETLTLQ
jgi:hypothetical protein